MAAKALTELCTFSKEDSILNEMSKSIESIPKPQKYSEKNSKQEYNFTLIEKSSSQPENKKTSAKVEDNYFDKSQSFQQKLETAAVLMDISKKVIISPPCSNPQSPRLCSFVDSSILNSVIKNKRPLNNNSEYEMDLSKKNSRCDLQNLIDFYSIQDKSVSPPEVCSDKHVFKEEKLTGKLDTNNLNIVTNSNATQTNTQSFPKIKLLSIETEVRHDRRTPDSLTSEEHGTDAATTQLWQALARSAGKKIGHTLLKQFVTVIEAFS